MRSMVEGVCESDKTHAESEGVLHGMGRAASSRPLRLPRIKSGVATSPAGLGRSRFLGSPGMTIFRRSPQWRRGSRDGARLSLYGNIDRGAFGDMAGARLDMADRVEAEPVA